MSEESLKNRRRSIGLIIETSNAYARGILQGVRAYMKEQPGWSIHLVEHSRGVVDKRHFDYWTGHGIIARIENEHIVDIVKQFDVPVVDVSAAQMISDIPCIETDDKEISELAARHLIDLGFRNFGFFGYPSFNWSRWRSKAFAKIIKENSFDCHTFEMTHSTNISDSWIANRKRLLDWLTKLPKPIGIMAAYDIAGQKLLDACKYLEISIPNEIAVIGVDNDELVCELSDPPLTSVRTNAHRTGYHAAEILNDMMKGREVQAGMRRVAPIDIEKRLSTDYVAIDNPIVSKALQFIRTNVHFGINVNDVLKEVPMSRRVFETQFKKALNTTPHELIVRYRIDRVKQLLLDTEMTLSEIAERTGFEHVEYMSSIFKKKTGYSPSNFRKRSVK